MEKEEEEDKKCDNATNLKVPVLVRLPALGRASDDDRDSGSLEALDKLLLRVGG